MSRVFVAEEALLNREVVVKLLPPDLMAGLSVERFRAEIQYAARLQHPHIVPVLSAGVIEYAGGTRGPYYTMPYIRGETIRARLERDGTLPAEEVRRILLDVADALAHAHDHGIVHRDIKPDNIFIAGKSAVVTDFGVSKALRRDEAEGLVTGIGVTLGTPGYMAPEQASGDQDLDHRADIYAVGVLAYELLSGKRPFEGTSIQQLLIAQASRTPVPLLELRPDTPPLLAAIVMRCLEKRPSDRYASAHELLAALEMLPSGSHSGATPIVPRPAQRRFRERAAGLGILVLVGAALLVWRPWSRAAGATAGGARVTSVAVLPPEYFR
ncbi:MAG TPA: serine/threonine-protein kinase, partial [Gemmatimonadales bacterium]|nr:serine/threonine-protein kinase [Gemmatimonadales bacterium]